MWFPNIVQSFPFLLETAVCRLKNRMSGRHRSAEDQSQENVITSISEQSSVLRFPIFD